MRAKAQVQKPASVSTPQRQTALPAETNDEVLPDIATQLNSAARLGHYLGAIDVIQRNAAAAQNYTPPVANAMQQYFRNNHVPDPYDVPTALHIHAIRGNILRSTIIAMTNEEAREEIEGYLLGLNNHDSNNLVNILQFTFDTAQAYPFIETVLGPVGMPVLSQAAIRQIRVRAQWSNAGYYQLYHCDGAV